MKNFISMKTDLMYQLISEGSQEIIIFFDSNGTIISCNHTAEDELGYRDEVDGINVADIFQKSVKIKDGILIIDPVYQEKATDDVAYRKNHTCFPVSLKIKIKKKRKSFVGMCSALNISVTKDAVQNLKQFQSEAMRFNEARNEFVANITHELRTPVNGILGLSENLLETELTSKQKDTVNIIHRCCTNMTAIINDFLDYAKISNNKLILEEREFDFRKFIKNLVDFNINKVNEKGLKLLVNVASDIPEKVVGDELRLTQILNNLLSNAIKFTTVGQIALEVVRTALLNHSVELFFMVIDTGIGISLEEKDKLFQSFSQVDGSITRRFGGTGLGLSISKMLVEAMHGTITVDSEKNKGSTFSFTVRLGITNQTIKSEESIGEHVTISPYLNKGMTISTKEEKKQSEEQPGEKSRSNNILDVIEKLSICIEMESWEKAEDLVDYFKRLTSNDQGGITKEVFRLVMAVRKEDQDTSLLILKELKLFFEEVS